MDGGVCLGRKKVVGLDGWGSWVRERGGDRAGWMGKWGKGEEKGQGLMDVGVG